MDFGRVPPCQDKMWDRTYGMDTPGHSLPIDRCNRSCHKNWCWEEDLSFQCHPIHYEEDVNLLVLNDSSKNMEVVPTWEVLRNHGLYSLQEAHSHYPEDHCYHIAWEEDHDENQQKVVVVVVVDYCQNSCTHFFETYLCFDQGILECLCSWGVLNIACQSLPWNKCLPGNWADLDIVCLVSHYNDLKLVQEVIFCIQVHDFDLIENRRSQVGQNEQVEGADSRHHHDN
jgi:hypothetical protein